MSKRPMGEILKDTLTKLLLIFIIIIFIVASFFVGYFIGGKYDLKTFFSKDSKNPQVEENKNKEVKYSVNESVISNLIPNLIKGVDCWAIEEFANDKKVVANDLSNQRAAAIVENNVYYFTGKDRISLEDYSNEIKKYLGTTYQFNPENLNYLSSLCPQYEYLKEYKEFLRKPNDCRQMCGANTTTYKVMDSNKKDDIITLNVKVLFGSKEGTNFYQDYGKTKFITDNPSELKSAISQGGNYIFTFKEEKGNIIFVSSEPSK